MIGPSVLSLFQLPAGIISAAVIDAAGTLGEAELLSAANQSPLRNFSSFGKAVETGLVYINVATRCAHNGILLNFAWINR